jgi:hypothetical protein
MGRSSLARATIQVRTTAKSQLCVTTARHNHSDHSHETEAGQCMLIRVHK